MRSRSVRSLGPLIVVAALFGPVPAGAETPWSRPFEADPEAALKAAAAVTVGEDAGSIVLLEEGFLEFDGRGRLSLRLRHVVRILTAAGVEGWSSVERTWAPWHQSRPEIRARVLGADGSVHHLDQKTVSDAPAGESDPDLYSDRRIVRAPLPAVAPGAVVEQEITIRDLEPEFSAGTVHTFYFGGGFPTLETRLVVRYPPSLPLRTWSSPALGLAARKSETEGGTTLSWEAGRLDPLENFETGAPTDVVQTRLVRFSTGESWNTVARGYASIVDGQLGAAARVGKRPPADRGATIRQALARLQREVRYTGVEFSEASIVPRTPAETMSRRYGDCKDKAALLVARLREAGVPAFVALLETGPGADVRPELPGLAFDHAIVFVPGPPVVWIDPTDELSQAGELPSTDQGRLALVADAATTGLVRTFEAASADNRRLETREFRLRDEKGAALVETREATGQMARDERATFSWGDRKRRQEEIEEYAKSEYDARGKVRLETSDPRELSTPFRVRVEIDEVGRGMTDDHEAVVALFPAHLTRHLPASLLRGDGEEPPPDETVPRGRRKRGPRTQDFVILEPFRSEWNYRIHPPAGYEVAGLPADGEELVGSGRLSQSYRREADGSVSAALWFDSGRTRLSPAEFEGYRTAVAELWKRPAVFVRFAQKGMQSLAAGDVAGAISEFRRLEATRPRMALHRCQMADALLQGGLGDAARREARAAVELEPSSARAQRTLGWALEHDALGRRFQPGWDRAGALRAYRKARELDPKDVLARASLALVLEVDEAGVRYAPKADLGDAIAEYRALRTELKEQRFNDNLVVALCFAERWNDLADTVRVLPKSELGSQGLVLAAAATGGVEAARLEAERLFPDRAARRRALERVGQTLVQLRLYSVAADLLSAAAAGADNGPALRAQADALRSIRRWDSLPFDAGDPQSTARRFLVMTVLRRQAEILALLSSELRADATKDEMKVLDEMLAAALARSRGPDITPDVLADLSSSLLRTSVDGAATTGFRVRIRGEGAGRSMDEDLFLVSEGGSLRVVASTWDLWSGGREVLRRAAAGDLSGARQWLDWVRERMPGGGDDALAGSPFPQLWNRDDPADMERIRVAAAALMSGSPLSDRALPILDAARASASAGERDAIDVARIRCLQALKRWRELEPAVSEYLRTHPRSDRGFTLLGYARQKLGQAAEARKLAEERLRRTPDDPPGLRMLSEALWSEGRLEDGQMPLLRMIEKGTAEAGDWNNLAWSRIAAGAAIDKAVEEAQRSVSMSRENNAPSLNTLAAALAEAGRPKEALDALFRSFAARLRNSPEGADWLILGRLAEQYGESAAAIEAFRKIKRDPDEIADVVSAESIARKRLRALGAR